VRVLFLLRIDTWRRDGRLSLEVAIIGAGELSRQLIRQLQQDGTGRYRIAGLFDDAPPGGVTSVEGYPVIGPIDDLVRLAQVRTFDEVVVALLDRRARRLRDRDLHRRRAGVAGEPAEHVEPARRARDQDAPVGLEEVGHRLLDQPEQHQHAEAFGGVGRRGEVLHGGARL
jgi:FlaA1/EpsC-like NDP-sugar epimerase